MADNVRKILEDWGLDLVTDLKAEINKEVKYESGQESALAGSVKYEVLRIPGGYTFRLSMNDYWKFVDAGVDGTEIKHGSPYSFKKKNIHRSAVTKDWQASHAIDSRSIIQEIQVNYYRKKGLKRKVKKLSIDKSAKALKFLIGRSIAKKGIKPRPFYEKVVNDRRIKQLSDALKPALKQDLIVEINNTIKQ